MLAQVIEVIGKIIGPFVLAAHRHRIATHIVFHAPSFLLFRTPAKASKQAEEDSPSRKYMSALLLVMI